MIEMLELSYKKFEAGITKCFIEELQTHLKHMEKQKTSERDSNKIQRRTKKKCEKYNNPNKILNR